MSDVFRRAAIGPLRLSDYFLILGSDSYVNALTDPSDSEHMILVSQVLVAKNAGKPVMILWIKGVEASTRTTLREFLKDMKVVGEHECLSDDPTEGDVEAIMNIIKENPL